MGPRNLLVEVDAVEVKMKRMAIRRRMSRLVANYQLILSFDDTVRCFWPSFHATVRPSVRYRPKLGCNFRPLLVGLLLLLVVGHSVVDDQKKIGQSQN